MGVGGHHAPQAAEERADVVGREVRTHHPGGLRARDHGVHRLPQLHDGGTSLLQGGRVGQPGHALQRGVLSRELRLRAQQRGKGLPGIGVLVLEAAPGQLSEPRQLAPEQLAHQHVLGGEVAVDGAHADSGAAGDVVHLGVQAVLRESLPPRLDDALAIATRVAAQLTRRFQRRHQQDRNAAS